jgi:hypothetical protein
VHRAGSNPVSHIMKRIKFFHNVATPEPLKYIHVDTYDDVAKYTPKTRELITAITRFNVFMVFAPPTLTIAWKHYSDTHSIHHDVLLMFKKGKRYGQKGEMLGFIVANRFGGNLLDHDNSCIENREYSVIRPLSDLSTLMTRTRFDSSSMSHQSMAVSPTTSNPDHIFRFNPNFKTMPGINKMVMTGLLRHAIEKWDTLLEKLTEVFIKKTKTLPDPLTLIRLLLVAQSKPSNVWYEKHTGAINDIFYMGEQVIGMDADTFWKSDVSQILLKKRLFIRHNKNFYFSAGLFIQSFHYINNKRYTLSNWCVYRLFKHLSDTISLSGANAATRDYIERIRTGKETKDEQVRMYAATELSKAPPCVRYYIENEVKLGNTVRWQLTRIFNMVGKLSETDVAPMKEVYVKQLVSQRVNKYHANDIEMEFALDKKLTTYPCRMILKHPEEDRMIAEASGKPMRKTLAPNEFGCPYHGMVSGSHVENCKVSRLGGDDLDSMMMTPADVWVKTDPIVYDDDDLEM